MRQNWGGKAFRLVAADLDRDADLVENMILRASACWSHRIRPFSVTCVAGGSRVWAAGPRQNNSRHARVVTAQQHPPHPRSPEQGLYATRRIGTDRPLPLSILRVRRRQRSSLGGTLRRTSMKLNEGFLEAADLRAKSSTRGNGPLSLCCSRREGTKICSLSKLVCRLAPRNR